MSCQGTATPDLVTLGRPEPPPVLDPPQPPTKGMRQRLEVFGRSVQFYAPGLKRWETSEWRPHKANRFLPISVTGTACALQCDHCGTKVLEGMVNVADGKDLFETASDLADSGTNGILLSGGSNRTGEVPLASHFEAMRRIREELGLKVIVHSGVVSPDLARGLADAGVDGVMLDVIGSEETIREVYHLDLTAEDFERSIALLAARELKIIPHIVLGLHYGRLVGEWNALEMIRRYPVSTLILVVLTPLVGTPMGHLAPPPLAEVVDFFAHAREAMRDTQVNLGCGRPMGAIKVA
ncbi:MAG: radical SAM protein, partial [Acidobacteriota bacterium]|nr:radical SAM protein [Acidobacteriota bacterium]